MSSVNYSKIIEDSTFLKKWKKEIRRSIQRINPSWETDEINEVLDDLIEKRLQLPSVTLDNNFTGETKDSNMLSVFDWSLERKPLVAGNGTFYKNQHEAINPIAMMLDGFLTNRKAIKKQMFKVDDVTSDLYKDLDRQQLNEKILANSYYGASGMPKSAFYSKWSGPATTGTAQSVISTTETFFEGYLVDNYKFIDINECFYFMNLALKSDYEIEHWIIPATKMELYDRMKNAFYDDIWQDDWEEPLLLYITNLNDDEVTKIFYKNNFMEFTRRHDKLLRLYDKIFSGVVNHEYIDDISQIPFDCNITFYGKTDKDKVKEYNSWVNNQFFMDPNSPPDTISEYLKELDNAYKTYVFIPFLSVDRIHRLKYFERRTVCIVDTDSNILAMDEFVDFFKNEILGSSDYGRSEENNRFIIINAMAYFITSGVQTILDQYGLNSNIPDEFRYRFNMKNEFYFDKLVIGKKKKRYMSSIKLREGNLINPYKPDVKGFDFMKATTSEEAKARFDKIVKKYVLESKVPDIPAILYELREFENDIRASIERGDKTYLPLGNAKDLAAYKNPYSQQGVRGAIAWNLINPDRQISFPSKVSILKLNIFTIEDAEPLRYTHPQIYETIRKEIFNSPIKDISSKGLQVLSIPGNVDIPEWCQPFIDYNTVINNIIGQFKGVLDVFGINCPEVGKTIKSVNRKTKKFSNVVRF